MGDGGSPRTPVWLFWLLSLDELFDKVLRTVLFVLFNAQNGPSLKTDPVGRIAGIVDAKSVHEGLQRVLGVVLLAGIADERTGTSAGLINMLVKE